MTSTTSTSISLRFTAVQDNGGDAVTAYKLYADDGNDSQENFSQVTGYSG